MVCATTGAVVDSVVSAAKGKGTGETTALGAMSERAAPGTIVVGDSIYENFFIWAALASAGCFGIFEPNARRLLEHGVPKRITVKRARRPKWMTLEAHRALPTRIKLRVVVSTHATCRDKYLVTSLVDDARYPDEAVLAEYAKRWDVELDFRSFKDTLGAGILGCKTPEMIDKELAVHVLGYNLIRLLMCEAAAATGLAPREISFRHAQQCWASWVMLRAPLDTANWQLLLERIAQRRVRNRPGRKEPRAVKRRAKPRCRLDMPRDAARMCCHTYERKGR